MSTAVLVDFKYMGNNQFKIFLGVGIIVLVLVIALALVTNSRKPATNQNANAGYSQNVQQAINKPIEKNGNWSTLSSGEKYQISYSKENGSDSFYITINAQPVLQVSQQAESEFVQKLGVSNEEACKLPVSISVPNNVDSRLSGYSFGLSFCTGKPHIADQLKK